MMTYFIDDPRAWRISKSGFTIRTGWADEKAFIAKYPGGEANIDPKRFKEWLDNAEKICDLYNSTLDGTEWQPIETAPKTGEHILVSNKGSFGICGGKEQPWMDVVHYWGNPGEEGFYPSNGPDEPYTNLTHWMPLPKAAEEESALRHKALVELQQAIGGDSLVASRSSKIEDFEASGYERDYHKLFHDKFKPLIKAFCDAHEDAHDKASYHALAVASEGLREEWMKHDGDYHGGER